MLIWGKGNRKDGVVMEPLPPNSYNTTAKLRHTSLLSSQY